jgi:5-methylcytosine-specific restriction endonuclease McrA
MKFLEKVDVLESYDWIVWKSKKEEGKKQTIFKAPAVVRLRHATKAGPMRVKFSRTNVYSRDNRECQYCGEPCSLKDLTLDHVVPKSMGGRTTWNNIVSCCRDCNTKKADRTPKQAEMKLINKPSYPSVKTFYQKYNEEDIPEQWNNWIF